MHVGVKEAVAQRVAQEGLHQRGGEPRQVQPHGLDRRASRKRRRVDPFERQHVLGGEFPVDGRHAEIAILARVLRHLGDGGRLQPQVHLDRDRAPERVDGLHQPQAPRLGGVALGRARREVERRKLGAQAPLDVGPQHFHGDGAAAFGSSDLGAMHLRDRGGRDGRTERRERRRQRPTQRCRDHRLRLALRERRHPVLQRLQIARQRDADDIRPRRQELAELHIGRPEPRQRRRQTHALHRLRWAVRSGARVAAPRVPAPAAAPGRPAQGHPPGQTRNPRARAETHGRAAEITNASRNAARRCRRSSRGATRGGSRRRGSSRRKPPASETGGSTRRDSGRARHRRRPRGPAPG